jgi:hypothetical protein
MADYMNPEFDLKELIERLKKVNERWSMHPAVGTKMEDGSIFAGISYNENTRTEYIVLVMPEDLPSPVTLNQARAAIEELNKDAARNLGHNDWKVPDIDTLHLIKRNQDKPNLRGTFNAASKHRKIKTAKYYLSTHTDGLTAGPNASKVCGLDFTTDNKRDLYSIGEWLDRNKDRLTVRPVRFVPYKGVEGPGKFKL